MWSMAGFACNSSTQHPRLRWKKAHSEALYPRPSRSWQRLFNPWSSQFRDVFPRGWGCSCSFGVWLASEVGIWGPTETTIIYLNITRCIAMWCRRSQFRTMLRGQLWSRPSWPAPWHWNCTWTWQLRRSTPAVLYSFYFNIDFCLKQINSGLTSCVANWIFIVICSYSSVLNTKVLLERLDHSTFQQFRGCPRHFLFSARGVAPVAPISMGWPFHTSLQIHICTMRSGKNLQQNHHGYG